MNWNLGLGGPQQQFALNPGSVHIPGFYRDLYFSYMDDEYTYGYMNVAPIIPVDFGSDFFYLAGKAITANMSTSPVGDLGALPILRTQDGKIEYDAGIRGWIYELSGDTISEARAGGFFDPYTFAMMILRSAEMQMRERVLVEQLKDTSKFTAETTLTGSNQWSHASSDPYIAIQEQCVARWKASGITPNGFTCSYPVWVKLSTHPKIIERLISTVTPSSEIRSKTEVSKTEFARIFDLNPDYVKVSNVQSELETNGIFEEIAVLHSTSMNPQGTVRRISAATPEKRDSYQMVERPRTDRAEVYNEIVEAKYDIVPVDPLTAYVWKDAIAR